MGKSFDSGLSRHTSRFSVRLSQARSKNVKDFLWADKHSIAFRRFVSRAESQGEVSTERNVTISRYTRHRSCREYAPDLRCGHQLVVVLEDFKGSRC